MDWRIPAIVAALLVVLLCILWRARRRRSEGPVTAADERAEGVAVAALDSYRAAQIEDSALPREELLVRALMAASGEPESQVRERIARAMALSSLDGSLQMLIVGVAGSGSGPTRSAALR